MSIGHRIRGLRVKSGLSQQQLAKQAGLGVSYLSRVENNRVSPTSRTLIKLSTVLEVTPASFFDMNTLKGNDTCPVSMDGRCVLDHPIATRNPPSNGCESYSWEHLQMLHRVNLLLQRGSPEASAALKYVVKNMIDTLEEDHDEGDDEGSSSAPVEN